MSKHQEDRYQGEHLDKMAQRSWDQDKHRDWRPPQWNDMPKAHPDEATAKLIQEERMAFLDMRDKFTRLEEDLSDRVRKAHVFWAGIGCAVAGFILGFVIAWRLFG